MNFKNYCIIIMGETKGCKIEVVKIAEDTPRFLEAKGVTIATFLSVAEPGEITEYFKSFSRNFLVFELDKDVSGYNLNDKAIQKLLFGHLEPKNIFQSYEDRTNRLIEEINNKVNLNKSKKENKEEKKGKSSKRVQEIMDAVTNGYRVTDDMTKDEMTKVINTILDKGTENLTDYDRKTLEDLSRRTSL